MMTRKKKVLFSIVTLMVFIIILGCVELFLQFLIPSLSNPLVTETTSSGIEFYQFNRSYLKKYFPAQSPIIPEIKPTMFRKHKTEKMFRIICLGESSMFGTPYQLSANIPAIVRAQVRHLYPNKEFEVINLGASAINSNVILDIAKDIVEFQPDLILIYTGHNEFYGPDGIGASWLQKNFPSTIQLKYRLNDLYLVKYIEQMLFLPKSNQSAERNLMQQVSQRNTVQLRSPESERIFELFEYNMREIVTIFKNHQIPMIISDITSNLQFPPFVYDTSDALRKKSSLFAAVESSIDAKKYSSALEIAQQLQMLDSTNAFVNYSLGRIYAALHQPAAARYYFMRARDEDLLKFRAPQRTSYIIKKIANELHIPFFSSDSIFASLDPNGIPGNNLFHEHLHPNAKGYYEIANAFVKKIQELQFIDTGESDSSQLLPFNFDSLNIPWIDLAYGDLSIQRLTSQWPFQNYSAQSYVIQTADPELKKIAHDVYTSKISLLDGCYKTAMRFIQLKNFRDALTTYEYLSQEYPYSYYPHYLSATVYKDMGEVELAINKYSLSLGYNPDYVYSHIDIGLLKINSGMFDEAIAHFQSAEKLADKEKSSDLIKATIYYGLAAAYANKGDLHQSFQSIQKSLRFAPDYQAAIDLNNQLKAFRK